MNNVYYRDKAGRKLFILGTDINQQLVSNQTDPSDPYKRLRAGSLEVANIIKDAEDNMDRIESNTVEALMYLATNIDELKYIHRNAPLKHQHRRIAYKIQLLFGVVDKYQIDLFLAKHCIFKASSISKVIGSIHWILFTILYIMFVIYLDIVLGAAMVASFVIFPLGAITHLMMMCILDCKIRFYKVPRKYKSLTPYNSNGELDE